MNDPSSNQRVALSQEGSARRAEILDHLKNELDSKQRQRRSVKRCLVVLLVLGAGVTYGIWNWPDAHPENPGPRLADSEYVPQPTPPATANQRIEIVQNRTGLLEKYVAQRKRPSRESRFESINDEQLLQWMSECGKPSFLARIGGEVKVIARKAPLAP